MRILATLILAILAVNCFPALAQDKPQLQVLSEVSLDLDGDGIMDRVVAVLVGAEGKAEKQDDGSYSTGDGETVDLYFYMKARDSNLDLSAAPTFIKKDILHLADDSTGLISIVDPLQRKGKASIALHNCHGCGASISWDETLTIASRNGQFLVAGYSRSWDENVHTADGNVDTTTGECDINYLTGRGVASKNNGFQQKVLKQKFHPVKLADWSFEKRPKACVD